MADEESRWTVDVNAAGDDPLALSRDYAEALIGNDHDRGMLIRVLREHGYRVVSPIAASEAEQDAMAERLRVLGWHVQPPVVIERSEGGRDAVQR